MESNDAEKNIESILAMVTELYERVRELEDILVAEGTLEPVVVDVEEYVADATAYVRETGRCTVSHLQRHFRLDYRHAFALLDALEVEGVIAPYRGHPERVVNL